MRSLAYVDALLYQQGGGGVPGVVDSDVSDAGLLEDGLPLLPVLCALDRAAVSGGEDEVVIRPPVPRLEAFGGLGFLVRFEERQECRRALERELALALALPEDQAAAGPLRALIRVADAVLRAWTPVTGVGPLLAVRLAASVMLVFFAILLAGLAVPLLSTGMWIVAAGLPLGALS
nr:hypothetical protein [Nonomuraea montanisoli]